MLALSGKRILIVEDEFLVAEMAADMLANLGASVVGPIGSIKEAFAAAKAEALDAALLDVNIQGERVDGVARLLAARGIPFVLSSGYAAKALSAIGPVTLEKPYTEDRLAQALMRSMRPPDAAASGAASR